MNHATSPEAIEFCCLIVQIYVLFVQVYHLLAGLLAPLLPVVLQLLVVPRFRHYLLHLPPSVIIELLLLPSLAENINVVCRWADRQLVSLSSYQWKQNHHG